MGFIVPTYLISLITLLITTTSALTQLAEGSSIGQTLIAASNFIWPTQGFISQGYIRSLSP